MRVWVVRTRFLARPAALTHPPLSTTTHQFVVVYWCAGDWVTVVDKKKSKREEEVKAAKVAAKAAKQAAKAAGSNSGAEESAEEKARHEAKAAAQLAAAKAKRAEQNAKPQISNEKELLNAVKQVVASDASGTKSMQLSTIGDRMTVRFIGFCRAVAALM